MNKVVRNAREAIADLHDGAVPRQGPEGVPDGDNAPVWPSPGTSFRRGGGAQVDAALVVEPRLCLDAGESRRRARSA